MIIAKKNEKGASPLRTKLFKKSEQPAGLEEKKDNYVGSRKEGPLPRGGLYTTFVSPCFVQVGNDETS